MAETSPQDVKEMRYIVAGMWVEVLLYGIFAAVYTQAVFFMLKNPLRHATKNEARKLLSLRVFTCVVHLMFVNATIHVGMTLSRLLRLSDPTFSALNASGPRTDIADHPHWDGVAHVYLRMIMMWLGNFLAMLNCGIRWKARITVLALPGLFFVVCLGGGIYTLVWIHHHFTTFDKVQPWLNQTYPMCITLNILTSGLTAWKVSLDKQLSIASSGSPSASNFRFVDALKLILESAAFYTLTLIILTALHFYNHPAHWILQMALLPTTGTVFIGLAVMYHREKWKKAHPRDNNERIGIWLQADGQSAISEAAWEKKAPSITQGSAKSEGITSEATSRDIQIDLEEPSPHTTPGLDTTSLRAQTPQSPQAPLSPRTPPTPAKPMSPLISQVLRTPKSIRSPSSPFKALSPLLSQVLKSPRTRKDLSIDPYNLPPWDLPSSSRTPEPEPRPRLVPPPSPSRRSVMSLESVRSRAESIRSLSGLPANPRNPGLPKSPRDKECTALPPMSPPPTGGLELDGLEPPFTGRMSILSLPPLGEEQEQPAPVQEWGTQPSADITGFHGGSPYGRFNGGSPYGRFDGLENSPFHGRIDDSLLFSPSPRPPLLPLEEEDLPPLTESHPPADTGASSALFGAPTSSLLLAPSSPRPSLRELDSGPSQTHDVVDSFGLGNSTLMAPPSPRPSLRELDSGPSQPHGVLDNFGLGNSTLLAPSSPRPSLRELDRGSDRHQPEPLDPLDDDLNFIGSPRRGLIAPSSPKASPRQLKSNGHQSPSRRQTDHFEYIGSPRHGLDKSLTPSSPSRSLRHVELNADYYLFQPSLAVPPRT